MRSRRCWPAFGLALLLAGCAAMKGPTKPHGPEEQRARTESPRKPAQSKPTLPRADQCGPVLDPNVWKIQCSSGDLAMMCRKSDPTDRRCGYKRSGKYRWTYGSYCKRALACAKRACR